MKLSPRIIVLIVLILLALVFVSTSANEKLVTVAYTPTNLKLNLEKPNLSAKAYAIFDVETGRVLANQNGDEVRSIASVTKLFTAAAVVKNLPLESIVEIKYEDEAGHGRAGRLSVGESYTYRELLFPLLLESSNDAAAVYARVANSEIVTKMNELAREAGAGQITLVDTSGLSDGNTASANELAMAGSYLYKEVPHVFDITRLSNRSGPYIGWTNNSPVLDNNYLGGKHGFTEAAQRTVVAIYEEDLAGIKKEVGYVILGSENLVGDMKILREFVHTGVSLE